MRIIRLFFCALLLMTLAVSMGGSQNTGVAHADVIPHVYLPTLLKKLGRANIVNTHPVYLPVMFNRYGLRSPFLGFEVGPSHLGIQRVQAQAQAAPAKWVRLNGASWRLVQPAREGGYDWSALATIEQDLLEAASAQLSPILIVQQYPSWATVSGDACSAVKELDAFATFMHELVQRYKNPPYNVHDWELGNEPDVDPVLVGDDSAFGCWGDASDRYYGGERYGNMLKIVAPKIREADPSARIHIGGLLLDKPTKIDCSVGTTPRNSSSFFEGILKSGAANDFDVVSYHAYNSYDPSKQPGELLERARQKVQFLKDVMACKGVSKPLVLSETALRCQNCSNPDATFFEAQANFLPRLLVRSLSDGVESVIWYTLTGPGWDNSGLLDTNQQPRPSYTAFQTLGVQTYGAALPPGNLGATYGAAVEAYRFTLPDKFVDVVWSNDGGPVTISAPPGFIAGYDRNGKQLQPGALTTDTGVIYVQRRP